MSEIEKLYENAGVEPIPLFSTRYGYEEGNYYMPPFSAEKQLSLIKWLVKTRQVHISCLLDNWIIEGFVRYGKKYDSFESALAGHINNLWQDLTEQEKLQIKRILE